MSASQFDKFLQIRAPGRLIEMLDAAASKRMVTVSDYVRSALIDRLKADGVEAGRWGMTVWQGEVR